MGESEEKGVLRGRIGIGELRETIFLLISHLLIYKNTVSYWIDRFMYKQGICALLCFHSLPNILRKFSHPLEELVSRVELELRQFEQEGDDYWLVKVTVF